MKTPQLNNLLSTASKGLQPIIEALFVVVIFIASALIIPDFWNGYLGEYDDEFYLRGVIGWLNDPPYVGSTHWELRHPYVLLLAISSGALGINEVSLVLPMLVVFWLLVVMVYVSIRQKIGVFAAISGASLLLTLPLLNIYATVVRQDLLEAFFVAASLIVFFSVALYGNDKRWLVLSGALAALAFLVRETSGSLIVFYLLLFVTGYRMRRSQYLLLVVGFAPLWLTEYLFLLYKTGDPFYRYVIDLAQFHPMRPDNVLNPTFDAKNDLAGAYRILDGGSQPYIKPLPAASIIDFGKSLNPIGQLFINHEYSIIFYLAIPAWIAFAAKRKLDPQHRAIALLLGLFSLCWLVIVGYGLVGRAKPNYFIPIAISAVVVLALFLNLWNAKGSRLLSLTSVVALIFVNFLFLEIHQFRPTYSGRILSEVATATNEIIYTDPVTKDFGKFFLATKGMADRILVDRPPAGSLFLYDEFNVNERIAMESDREKFLPGETWQLLSLFERRERLPGFLLRMFGLQDQIPPWLFDRISHPEPKVALFRAM